MIYQWLLLFQEFTFEVIAKPGRSNLVPDHLSRLESGELGGSLDDQLLDSDLFRTEAVPDYLEDISNFPSAIQCPSHYTTM